MRHEITYSLPNFNDGVVEVWEWMSNFIPHRERFPHHRGLTIPTCITARAWRMRRDAYRDRYLAVSFEVVGGKNVPGIPCTCATRNFAYLVRGPWYIETQKCTFDVVLTGYVLFLCCVFACLKGLIKNVTRELKPQLERRDLSGFLIIHVT